MKVIHIFAINTLLMTGVIANAFSMKKQFYPSVVYITQSKPSVAIIGIEVVLCLILYIEFIAKLFLGELYPSEREQLNEHIWPSFLDSCFAFAIFSKNSDYLFYFRLLFLFSVKSLQFMAYLRVKSMPTVIQMPKHFHIRFVGLLLYLGILNIYHLYSSAITLKKSFSFEMIFSFEYSLLLLSLIHISCEYILECIEQMNGENGWDQRVVYSNYLELVFVSLKSILQIIVIRLLLKVKVLPIFMIRNVVNNFKKIKDCGNKIVMSLRAISRIDAFPNPSAEDLRGDNMCTICRDEIQTRESAKKLFCRHMFHIVCLKAWFRRQQRCPTCRSDVINARVPEHGGQQNQG